MPRKSTACFSKPIADSMSYCSWYGYTSSFSFSFPHPAAAAAASAASTTSYPSSRGVSLTASAVGSAGAGAAAAVGAPNEKPVPGASLGSSAAPKPNTGSAVGRVPNEKPCADASLGASLWPKSNAAAGAGAGAGGVGAVVGTSLPAAGSRTTMSHHTRCANLRPLGSTARQYVTNRPALVGAFISTATSVLSPGSTLPMATSGVTPMSSPPTCRSDVSAGHGSVPTFLNSQILVKDEPPAIGVASGMLTSRRNFNMFLPLPCHYHR